LAGRIDRVNTLRIIDQGTTDEGAPDGGLDLAGVTVFYPWDLEIDQVDSAYLPENGNEALIVARVVPAAPATIRIFYNLADVSDESGDAMNHGSQSATDKDFKFEAQSGFTVISTSKIETAAEQNSATVQLSCFDYGAYGKIRAEIRSVSGVARGVTDRPIITGHLTGSPAVFTINVPRDDDGNNIADAWAYNSGGADDDADATPNGDGTAGDRLSRYEEYRGFFVSGSHVRTNPNVKDVFICDKNNVNQRGDFTDSNLGGANVHWINDTEFYSVGSRSINHEYDSHHLDTQRCILLTTNPPVSSRTSSFWGEATVQSPWETPGNYHCWLFTDNQQGGMSGSTISLSSVTNTDSSIILGRNSTFPPWEASGKVKVENEIVSYSSKTPDTALLFTLFGLTRGIDGTTAAFHRSGAVVTYFSDLNSTISRFLAHEAGHNLHMNHDTVPSLMLQLSAGADMSNSSYHIYRASGSVTGSLQEFRVK
jgi:hypothetical protein